MWSGFSISRSWNCDGLSCGCTPTGIRARAGVLYYWGESSFQLKFISKQFNYTGFLASLASRGGRIFWSLCFYPFFSNRTLWCEIFGLLMILQSISWWFRISCIKNLSLSYLIGSRLIERMGGTWIPVACSQATEINYTWNLIWFRWLIFFFYYWSVVDTQC